MMMIEIVNWSLIVLMVESIEELVVNMMHDDVSMNVVDHFHHLIVYHSLNFVPMINE
jgi:hypothetical protein